MLMSYFFYNHDPVVHEQTRILCDVVQQKYIISYMEELIESVEYLRGCYLKTDHKWH